MSGHSESVAFLQFVGHGLGDPAGKGDLSCEKRSWGVASIRHLIAIKSSAQIVRIESESNPDVESAPGNVGTGTQLLPGYVDPMPV